MGSEIRVRVRRVCVCVQGASATGSSPGCTMKKNPYDGACTAPPPINKEAVHDLLRACPGPPPEIAVSLPLCVSPSRTETAPPAIARHGTIGGGYDIGAAAVPSACDHGSPPEVARRYVILCVAGCAGCAGVSARVCLFVCRGAVRRPPRVHWASGWCGTGTRAFSFGGRGGRVQGRRDTRNGCTLFPDRVGVSAESCHVQG